MAAGYATHSPNQRFGKEMCRKTLDYAARETARPRS
jgi:hypothetical protein